MIRVEKLARQHIECIRSEKIDREIALSLVSLPMQWAVVHEDDVVAIFGAIEHWEGRVMIWSIMGENSGRWMFQLTKIAVGFVSTLKGRRIEATVEAGFEAGYRWMRMLGFAREARLHKYLPDGGDVVMYVQLREEE